MAESNPAPNTGDPQNASTALPPPNGAGLITCPLCGHTFSHGGLQGNMYCVKCGRRFNPRSHMEETISLPGPDSGPVRSPGGDTDEGGEAEERFGNYDILEEIARGGMGVVYRARQRTLRRIVALKVLRGGEGATEEDLARFMREAKAAASLSHPNIVPIHELSVWKGKHFFTMDYIEGMPLDRVIESENLTPYHTCELIETIAHAIQYAHTRGIIHRDLKPANIIIDTNGRPMLTDFGLAVNLASDAQSQHMTRTGAVMGTIPYIPPEQASGHVDDVDARSDVYSLGAVMYEMLVGQPPFQGDTQFELLRRVIHQDPPPPRHINPKINPDVETICIKCLEKDRTRRYESADALADDCRRFLHGEVIEARPITVRYRLKKYIARYRGFVAMGAALLLMTLAALFFQLRGRQRTQKLEHEVKKHKTEVQTLEKEKQEQDEELRRDWRQEFTVDFRKPFISTSHFQQAIQRRRLWYREQATHWSKTQHALRLNGLTKKHITRGELGVPIALPLDFELILHVRPPTENAGTFYVLIDTNNQFYRQDLSYVIQLGVPGRPGGKLTKGDASLAEKPNFVLTPEQWHQIRILRVEGFLRVFADAHLILETELSRTPAGNDTPYVALGALDGSFLLEKISVDVRGLSRAMIGSLLEVAHSLTLHNDYSFAAKLYERVAKEENLPSRDHILALKGFAKCVALSSSNINDLTQACDNLFETMRVTRTSGRGEREYLKGLAVAEFQRAPDWNRAIALFRKASQESIPSQGELLRFEEAFLIGPFDAPGVDGLHIPFAPENEFDENAKYQGKNGSTSWKTFGTPDKQGEILTFPFPGAPGEHAVYYYRRVFHCWREIPVTIYTGSDDGLSVWLNGKLLLSKNDKRAVIPRSDATKTTLQRGRNTVLMKIHNNKGIGGCYLEIKPDGRSQMGMYGRLAQLEQALAHLRTNNIQRAIGNFRELQVRGELTILANEYTEEIRVGETLARVNKHIDTLLRTPKELDIAFGLLEAMRTLYPDAGEDLALRYHRLAQILSKTKSFEKADAALQMASSLSPSWHKPRFDRAMLYFQLKRDTEGEAELTAATQALPENLDLHLSIAQFYLETIDGAARNAFQAYRAASRALQISERLDPTAWRLCAKALYAQGNTEQALHAMKRVIELEEKIPAEDKIFFETLQQEVESEPNLYEGPTIPLQREPIG